MSKVINIENKTHAYILPDGTTVRAINAKHVEAYQKDKVQVYACDATKTVDGVKIETQNFYVPVANFVKRSTARATVTEKQKDTIKGLDLSSMSAEDLAKILNLK